MIYKNTNKANENNKKEFFNFFQLQQFAPILMIIGIFAKFSLNYFLCIFFVFLISIPFSHLIINRLFVFLLLGIFRSFFIDYSFLPYSFKYTSFYAEILDYQIKENGNYLLLNNFKYIKTENEKYQLDEFPSFPLIGLMKVENIELYKNAKKIQAIGRFYLPCLTYLPQKKMQNIAKGVLKEIKIIEFNKANSFKKYYRQKFDQYLNKNAAQFAKAIFLADIFAIHKDIRRIFQKAGVAHLLGVSILNLTILLIILYYLFYYLIGKLFLQIALKIPLQVLSKIISLFFIAIYTYFVGFEYPLLRAIFMSSFGLISMFYGKNLIENFFLSAAFILFLFPEAIYDLGFQLSFGGVLGIYAFPYKFNNKILSLIFLTLSASSVIVPISIFNFQEISLQPFLANLICVPFLSFIIIPVLLLFMIFSNFCFAQYLGMLLNVLFDYFLKITQFLSNYGINIHINPIHINYLLFFISCFFIFVLIKEKIRYFFFVIGYAVFFYGVYQSFFYKDFILINLYGIGLVQKKQIIVYPKCNFMGKIWAAAYNLPCVDANLTNVFQKDCQKILINEKIGIVQKEIKGFCKFKTKDYIFLYDELLHETQIIKNV